MGRSNVLHLRYELFAEFLREKCLVTSLDKYLRDPGKLKHDHCVGSGGPVGLWDDLRTEVDMGPSDTPGDPETPTQALYPPTSSSGLPPALPPPQHKTGGRCTGGRRPLKPLLRPTVGRRQAVHDGGREGRSARLADVRVTGPADDPLGHSSGSSPTLYFPRNLIRGAGYVSFQGKGRRWEMGRRVGGVRGGLWGRIRRYGGGKREG